MSYFTGIKVYFFNGNRKFIIIYINFFFINGKYKNKLIILDNASSHRNQLVKDVRSKIESTNPEEVLNGNLDKFIEGNIFKS